MCLVKLPPHKIYVIALFPWFGGVLANEGFSVNMVFFLPFLKGVLIFQFNINFWRFHRRLAHIKIKKMFESISYLSTTVLTALFVWSITTVPPLVAALTRVDTPLLICTGNLITLTSYWQMIKRNAWTVKNVGTSCGFFYQKYIMNIKGYFTTWAAYF